MDEPVLVVLATTGDHMASWYSVGEALGRVLLTAANYDLNAAFLNQPVGIDHVRARVRELVEDDMYPQLLFRIGYGVPETPTRRLPVQHVTPRGGDDL